MSAQEKMSAKETKEKETDKKTELSRRSPQQWNKAKLKVTRKPRCNERNITYSNIRLNISSLINMHLRILPKRIPSFLTL